MLKSSVLLVTAVVGSGLAVGGVSPAVAAEPVTVTFAYNGVLNGGGLNGTDGSPQSWTVPAGVHQATFVLEGASGGGVTDDPDITSDDHWSPGGLGARVTAVVAVQPGQQLTIVVGGQPYWTSWGGYNGGGQAGGDTGAGGGATDVRTGADPATRILVAGGGGGGGFPGETPLEDDVAPGGDGGNAGTDGQPGGQLDGQDGQVAPSGRSGEAGHGGHGGCTAVAPQESCSHGGTDVGGGAGGNGDVHGNGGNGAGGGGGGGGGWYGGGGGSGGAGQYFTEGDTTWAAGGGSGGGGAGSSFVPAHAQESTIETRGERGHGRVTITFTPADPAPHVEQDADGDGVADAVDRCDAVPAATVTGCPRLARRLTIFYDATPGAFHGRLRCAEPVCAGGKPVILWRVAPGPDRRIAKVTTTREGRWRVRRIMRAGAGYYATSPRILLSDTGICVKAVSTKLKRLR